MKVLGLVFQMFMVVTLSACANMGNNSGQVLPPESRATPELALLSDQAQLADAGGDAAKAESLYKSVLRKTPNDADAWFRLGNLYANNNRPDEAAIAYQRCLIADNAYTKAWHNLSMVRLRQAYATMLQAQTTVDEADPLAQSIDDALEQLSHIIVITDQTKPVVRKSKGGTSVTTSTQAIVPEASSKPAPTAP